jgi:hypothetical protein
VIDCRNQLEIGNTNIRVQNVTKRFDDCDFKLNKLVKKNQMLEESFKMIYTVEGKIKITEAMHK